MPPARADVSASWTSHGPFGASASSIAIDESHPLTMYAGTPNGVWRTDDGAESWSRTGLRDAYVSDVEIDPLRHRTVYAVGWPGPVYRSTDGGATWSRRGNGLENTQASRLFLSPFHEGVAFASTRRGLFKTIDGGRTWKPMALSSPDPVLAFDPVHPSMLLAGTTTGIHRSTDGGRSWTLLTDFGARAPNVFALAFDPMEPNIIVAGSGAGTFRSDDHGRTWDHVAYLESNLRDIVFARSDPNIAYATEFSPSSGISLVVSSTNAGITWYERARSTSFDGDIAVTPSGLRAFAASATGIFGSALGHQWVEWDAGIIVSRVAGLAVDPSDASRLFAFNARFSESMASMSESTDGGDGWLRLLGAPLYVSALAVSSTDPSTLYAGSGRVLYRSTDGGGSWSALSVVRSGLIGPTINSILVNPTNDRELFLGVYHGGVYASSDGGKTLARMPFPNAKARVVQLAQDPVEPDRLVAAAKGDGAFESQDGGQTWRSITPAGLGAHAVAIGPGTGTIYVGSNAAGASVTHDDGKTWTQGTGVDGRGGVDAIVVDPAAPSTAFIGVNGHGVYRSDDDGATWTSFDQGLASRFVTSLAIAPDGSLLHAGTQSSGVFDTPL